MAHDDDPLPLCSVRGLDPFSEDRDEVLAVLHACRDCPVAGDCRRRWEQLPVPFGVWGGRTARRLLADRAAAR